MYKNNSIVVLGAGFGGLRAALVLAKKIKAERLDASVTLIDQNKYHTYTPTLYEIATTSKETANYCQLKEIVTFPVADIVKGVPIKFINDKVTNLDLLAGDVHCGGKILKFNYLVIAAGSETNYFGVPGLKEEAYALKSFTDALEIRDALLDLAQTKKDCIEIVIGGGGSTGVELAGELQLWVKQLQQEFHCQTRITIVQAGPTILPGFEEKIIKTAEKRLAKLGVNISTNETIKGAANGIAMLESQRGLAYDILIWTGGVRAPQLVGDMPVKTEIKGRMVANEGLECLPQTPELKLYGMIYALGDAVCFYDPVTKKPIPGVARAAISQADVVAHNIIERLRAGKNSNYTAKPIQYKPMEYPYVIPIGGKYAIAKLGPIILSGFSGWVLKGLVELNYLLSIMSFWRAIKLWLKGLSIFVKNDRLG